MLFFILSKTEIIILARFILSSVIAFNFDKSKNVSFGIKLTCPSKYDNKERIHFFFFVIDLYISIQLFFYLRSSISTFYSNHLIDPGIFLFLTTSRNTYSPYFFWNYRKKKIEEVKLIVYYK